MILRSLMMTAVSTILLAGPAAAEYRNECVFEGRQYGKDCRVCVAGRGYNASGQLQRCTETRSGTDRVLKWQSVTGMRCDPKLTKPTC